MGPKEEKVYWKKGHIKRHRFIVAGLRHGESKYYSSNGKGRLSIHAFYLRGLRHGPYEFYQDDAELADRVFCIHGSNILDFPFLPEKPKPLSHKSTRTRFETIEL